MSKDLALHQTEWDLHENTNLVPLEFTEEIKPDLFGLNLEKAQEMTRGLSAILAERDILKDAYIDVIGLEITTENLPTFKNLRLKFLKNRTQGLDKWKEKEKAFYLAGGNFVQAIYNKEVAINKEMEDKLMEAEKFFENQEKEKARSLNLERIEKIRPYVSDADNMNFSEFDDQSFDDFVLGKKTRFENEQKEREAEAKRMEEELLAEIARQKAVEEENARLKAEAEEKEKALAKERAEALAKQKAIQDEADRKAREEKAKQDAVLKAEQEAKAKLETELKAKLEAEARAENERLAKIEADKKEAEKLAKAPIKKQLNVWVNSFNIANHPVNNEVAEEIIAKFEAFKKWSLTQVNNL